MKYTSRGLKRRGDSDKWHVTLSHKDPLTGELVPSYHTVTARTEKQAMKRRDELILDLTTGMRRGEICGLRWSDIGECDITVNRAISLDSGTPYVKDPKTDGSHRTIPLTRRLYAVLRAMEKDQRYVATELGLQFGDPYILGTPEPGSRRRSESLERLHRGAGRDDSHVVHHPDCCARVLPLAGEDDPGHRRERIRAKAWPPVHARRREVSSSRWQHESGSLHCKEPLVICRSHRCLTMAASIVGWSIA